MHNPHQQVVIFSSLNLTEVHLMQSFLADQGYDSIVRGAYRAVLAGEVPMDDARIELLVHAQYVALALETIKQHKSAPITNRLCSSCQELNPSNFELCWQCETPFDTD
jgi:hypothetical protein